MAKKFEIIVVEEEPFPWPGHIFMLVISLGFWTPFLIMALLYHSYKNR